ncbi:protein of unknown function DUF1080 (plasmid) [Gemmatirosa kalamazoonensis]|uniref:3-keto-alpha-glucoside-1,2-lyase/3-keto-2-hydroxy-glucal hydratase domain-containing protein n=1 Tax=Gemmatirosa kalamazoonensis TaxID=861299 RepID=W0RV71_9BACT|nr:DUF1080 domain-containing protein [Gemmatirosa kalamazoonensis]AHG93488.1 protein of unknown function DUF1080 [Gemmatirosa kalamazoonensis]
MSSSFARRTLPFVALVAAAILGGATDAAAQHSEAPIIGRWDFTLATPNGSAPSWLEVMPSGNGTLVGRFVAIVGSARPVSRVEFANGTVRFAIPPQWERGTGDLRVEGTLAGDKLTGTLTMPDGQSMSYTAVRAPDLVRPTPKWGTPIALFNGKDITGWSARGENKWHVADGVLTNGGGGANLVTNRKFDDFKLHVEFRYPKGSNSGIYLRGRYEVQIEDSERRTIPHVDEVGGVYGFLAPIEDAARAPEEWQTYDITLVGRRVTVVLNGKTVIADQLIPGPTGGALDANEGEPGPIYLQGDHGRVDFRKIVLTPAVR